MMSLLLMFSSPLLAAPVECETLETMHRAGVNSAYMVDLVMNSEIDAATVACLERGGVPAEVAYAARYRMQMEAEARVWAKAQVDLLAEAAYDLSHGNSTSAAQKSRALLNSSPPNEDANIIYHLATQPKTPIEYAGWTYHFVPSPDELGGSILVSTESINTVTWNKNSVKGTLRFYCDANKNVAFATLQIPGAVFVDTAQNVSDVTIHSTRARSRQEGVEPIQLAYLSPEPDRADRIIFFQDSMRLIRLVYDGEFIIEVKLQGHLPQSLIFEDFNKFAPLFLNYACVP